MILKNNKLCHFLGIPNYYPVFVIKFPVLAKAVRWNQLIFTLWAEQEIANLRTAVDRFQ